MKKSSLDTYLSEIGNESLLSTEEEKTLAKKISNGDAKAFERLTTANLKYVISIAKQYRNQGLCMDDIVAEGNIGLIKAVGKYKTSSGKRFAMFAAPYIRRNIEQAIAQQEGLYKLPKDADTPLERKKNHPLSADAPLGSKQGVSLMSILADPDALVPDKELNDNDYLTELKAKLCLLDGRDKDVVSYLYGIDRQHLTMAETADKMGLKRERVRQIRDKALRKLRKKD